MKIIKLTQGKETIVDDDVYEWAKEFKWCTLARKNNSIFYAVRTNKKLNKTVSLHREIMNAFNGTMVDHINGNGLDNRKCNLRLCTHKENARNSKKPVTNTSGYKGVHWNTKNNSWRVRIEFNSKKYSLGYFSDKIEAAKAYDKAAIKYFGEFARTNFPIED